MKRSTFLKILGVAPFAGNAIKKLAKEPVEKFESTTIGEMVIDNPFFEAPDDLSYQYVYNQNSPEQYIIDFTDFGSNDPAQFKDAPIGSHWKKAGSNKVYKKINETEWRKLK